MHKTVMGFVCLAERDSVGGILTVVIVAFIVRHVERLDLNIVVIPLFGLK